MFIAVHNNYVNNAGEKNQSTNHFCSEMESKGVMLPVSTMIRDCTECITIQETEMDRGDTGAPKVSDLTPLSEKPTSSPQATASSASWRWRPHRKHLDSSISCHPIPSRARRLSRLLLTGSLQLRQASDDVHKPQLHVHQQNFLLLLVSTCSHLILPLKFLVFCICSPLLPQVSFCFSVLLVSAS